jgi:hypothetical protein
VKITQAEAKTGDFANRGHWLLKVALCPSGGVVAAATTISQLKASVVGPFH